MGAGRLEPSHAGVDWIGAQAGRLSGREYPTLWGFAGGGRLRGTGVMDIWGRLRSGGSRRGGAAAGPDPRGGRDPRVPGVEQDAHPVVVAFAEVTGCAAHRLERHQASVGVDAIGRFVHPSQEVHDDARGGDLVVGVRGAESVEDRGEDRLCRGVPGQPEHPTQLEQRVVLVTAVAVDLLLATAADLVQGPQGEPNEIDAVRSTNVTRPSTQASCR